MTAFTLQRQSWVFATDLMDYKAENIYYLAHYRKSIPIPNSGHWVRLQVTIMCYFEAAFIYYVFLSSLDNEHTHTHTPDYGSKKK